MSTKSFVDVVIFGSVNVAEEKTELVCPRPRRRSPGQARPPPTRRRFTRRRFNTSSSVTWKPRCARGRRGRLCTRAKGHRQDWPFEQVSVFVQQERLRDFSVLSQQPGHTGLLCVFKQRHYYKRLALTAGGWPCYHMEAAQHVGQGEDRRRAWLYKQRVRLSHSEACEAHLNRGGGETDTD